MFDLGTQSVRAMTLLLVEKIMKWRQDRTQSRDFTVQTQIPRRKTTDVEPARSSGDLIVLEALSSHLSHPAALPCDLA